MWIRMVCGIPGVGVVRGERGRDLSRRAGAGPVSGISEGSPTPAPTAAWRSARPADGAASSSAAGTIPSGTKVSTRIFAISADGASRPSAAGARLKGTRVSTPAGAGVGRGDLHTQSREHAHAGGAGGGGHWSVCLCGGVRREQIDGQVQ